MDTGTHINAALFITPTVFLPQTLDFVERELGRRRRKRGIGEKKKGRGASYKTHFSFSKYFAHPYRFIRPMQMLGLPVKDVPP